MSLWLSQNYEKSRVRTAHHQPKNGHRIFLMRSAHPVYISGYWQLFITETWQKPSTPDKDMLILTRRIKEGMSIGTGIHLKVLGIQGNQVKLGIEAPPHLEIFRDELWGAEAQGLPAEGFQETPAPSKKKG